MPAPTKKPSPKVAWHLAALGIPALWEQGLRGLGVRVAILDSGQARVAGLSRPSFEYLDHTGKSINPTDLDGHGTACASIIGSNRNSVIGIAPEVEISSFRVLDSGDRRRKVESAFDAVLARSDIDVVLCAFIIDKAGKSLMERVRALAMRGTVVVASAGNDANVKSAFPEHTPHAIAVAGIDEKRRALPGSRLGLWVDIAAPGKKLAALNKAGMRFNFGDSSGAAAVAAGVAALLLGTQTEPDERRKLGLRFEGLVRSEATPLPGTKPDAVGHGLLNPVGILKAINKEPE